MSRDLRTYVRLDVAFFRNFKWYRVERYLTEAIPDVIPDVILDVLREAREAYLEALCYCGESRSDGLFPVETIKRLARVRREEAITALFEVDLWINHPGGMAEIHDFLEHQPSAADREKASQRSKKAIAARWKNTDRNTTSNTDRITDRNSRRGEESISTKPSSVPLAADAAAGDTETTPTPTPRPNRKRGTTLPDDWAPNPKHADIAAERGVTCWLEAEKFRDWAAAKGTRYRDWDAAFRNWLRRAEPDQLPAPATDLRAAENARRDAERRAEREARERERAQLAEARKANPHAAQAALEAVPNLRDKIAANRRQKAN